MMSMGQVLVTCYRSGGLRALYRGAGARVSINIQIYSYYVINVVFLFFNISVYAVGNVPCSLYSYNCRTLRWFQKILAACFVRLFCIEIDEYYLLFHVVSIIIVNKSCFFLLLHCENSLSNTNWGRRLLCYMKYISVDIYKY